MRQPARVAQQNIFGGVHLKTAVVEKPLVIAITLELGVDLERGKELVSDVRGYIEDMDTGAGTTTDVVSIEAVSHPRGTNIVIIVRGLGPGEDTELADALEMFLEDGSLVFDGGVEVFGMTTSNPPHLQLVK